MLHIIDTLQPLGNFFAVKAEHVGVGESSLNEVLNASAIELSKKVNKEYVDEQISNIPKVTKTSQLQNDSGFLTQHQSLAEYAKKSEIPTKVSAFENDKGYLTQHQSLVGYVKTTDERLSDARPASDVKEWAKANNKPTYTKDEIGLSQVDNTSDIDKPVSTATQNAINAKASNTRVEALENRVESAEIEQTAINARIDNIIAIPEGSIDNVRLEDICIKADGSSATSPGNAVREQVTDLKDDMYLSTGSYTPSIEWQVGYYISTSNKKAEFATFEMSNVISVKKNSTIRFTAAGYSGNVAMIAKKVGDTYSYLVASTGSDVKTYSYKVEEDMEIVLSCDSTKAHECKIINELNTILNGFMDIPTIKGVKDVVNSATASAPYDNVNNLPVNSVVLYIYTTGIQNLPPITSGHGVNIITYNCKDSAIGAAQLAVESDGSMFVRINWNGWKLWKKVYADDTKTSPLIKGVKNIWNASTLTEPYTDLNTVPANTMVLYGYVTGVLNLPAENIGGFNLLTYNYNDDISGAVQIAVTNANKMYFRVNWGAGYKSWVDVTGSSGGAEDYTYTSLAVFEKFGVIGDSFASGEVVNPDFTDHYGVSWGQIMARANGTKCVNFSQGGASTASWLGAVHGLPLLQSTEPQNIYYCCLGINDYYQLGLDYLGSIDDIKSDYTQNANSFYGNYGKIISNVKLKAPKAKIIMFTIMDRGSGTTKTAYNNAIKEIANHFSIPYINVEDDALFTSAFYKNNMLGEHPTATMYGCMAKAFERLISKCIVNNWNYFKTYEGND